MTSPVFERLGTLVSKIVKQNSLSISVADYPDGIHAVGDIFFRKTSGNIAWVISRVCDHAGGKLILRNDLGCAVCPMHNWRLNLDTLEYVNVPEKKRTLPFEVKDGLLHVDMPERAIELPSLGPPVAARMRFLSHACVELDIGGVKIVTDPWLVGPAFVTGWWPSFEPKNDVFDVVRNADIIYVSHNHPDHCSLETLSLIDKDKPIIIPAFQSSSVKNMLDLIGHRAIVPLDLGVGYQVRGTNVSLAILKSGDFRDDSGLYVSAGGFHGVLTVDSNYLNGGTLPRNADLLMTSFAGGASGYPICFEMYPPEQRSIMIERRRQFVATSAISYVQAVQPRVFVPYAGFFKEAAERDTDIREANRKNSVAEMLELARRVVPGVQAFDPTKTDEILITPDKISASQIDRPKLYTVDEGYISHYLEQFRQTFGGIEPDIIVDYFEQSEFRDDLRLLLVPTDDRFTPTGKAFDIDFSGARPLVTTVSAAEAEACFTAHDEAAGRPKRIKLIKVRAESLGYIISNMMPWEDLSIGFQCRINRKPDVYNADFWYHFTNTYVGDEHRRGSSIRCDGCTKIIQGLNSQQFAAAPAADLMPHSNGQ
jgi:CMP-N-acetylneuraminate monooxygenase